MGDDLSSYITEQAAAKQTLGFAAVVVPAPQQRAHTVDDEPDHFDRHVATIAAHISRLALPLSTLSSIAAGLEASEGVPWGRLAHEPRRDYRDFSDLHFAGLVLATVEAIREVGLTLSARNHVELGAHGSSCSQWGWVCCRNVEKRSEPCCGTTSTCSSLSSLDPRTSEA